MDHSRRNFNILLPALLAATANAKTEQPPLPSKCYPFEELPVKTNGPNQARQVFDGVTHAGYPIELHMTTLAPFAMPHPPHHHVHEEMILVQEGTLEVTISGHKTKVGPGSVAYVASNEEHGWQNMGTVPAQYFVVAMGREQA